MVITVMIASCQHEPVLPEQQVSFSTDIQPILQQGCWHAGCHGSTQTGPFELVTYEQVIDKGDVKAGDPKDSELYQVITADPSSDDFMPQSPYNALTERQIKLIYIWIAQGAKNN